MSKKYSWTIEDVEEQNKLIKYAVKHHLRMALLTATMIETRSSMSDIKRSLTRIEDNYKKIDNRFEELINLAKKVNREIAELRAKVERA